VIVERELFSQAMAKGCSRLGLWGVNILPPSSVRWPVVFEAEPPEFAGDVDAGFVGEAHAGGERGGVAADEVGPFVAVHAIAVAEAGGLKCL